MTDRFGAARQVLAEALRHLSFPCVAVDVGDSTRSLWSEAFGQLTYSPDAPAATAETIFDLASLTKVLSTTLLVMRAYEQGALDIDDPVGHHIPEWRGADRSHVTIRDLLSHASGLPAHRDYYLQRKGREAYTNAICTEPLEYRPRTKSVYSDLGFMLLGFILQSGHSSPDLAEGEPVDRLVQRFDAVKAEIAPADDLQFRPPRQWQRRIAPTEIDWWRGRLLRGDVHDENTCALGAAAGQAGLFGTANAVGAVARHLLQVLAGRIGAFRGETMRLFTTRRSDVPGSRALGWDTMLPTSSCGSLMSPEAFGHTGFTGTSLWIDPRRGVYAVLLTNRVHPTRSNTQIQSVRRAFHDAVMHGLSAG